MSLSINSLTNCFSCCYPQKIHELPQESERVQPLGDAEAATSSLAHNPSIPEPDTLSLTNPEEDTSSLADNASLAPSNTGLNDSYFVPENLAPPLPVAELRPEEFDNPDNLDNFVVVEMGTHKKV